FSRVIWLFGKKRELSTVPEKPIHGRSGTAVRDGGSRPAATTTIRPTAPARVATNGCRSRIMQRLLREEVSGTVRGVRPSATRGEPDAGQHDERSKHVDRCDGLDGGAEPAVVRQQHAAHDLPGN